MHSWRLLLVGLSLLIALLSTTYAEEIFITSDDHYTTCSGVWSKSAIPGGVTPFIKVTLGPKSHGKTALLIYEYNDFKDIGALDKNTGEIYYICDEQAVADKMCTNRTLGDFIVHVPAERANGTSILTSTFDMDNQTEVALYKIEKTGYYCVAVVASVNPSGNATYFESWIEWKFPYGELPASEYPKLVFYAVFALVYLAVGIFWAIQCFRHWHDILPVQHFLSAAIFYLAVEMAFNWGFWEAYNQTGTPSYGLMVLVALLNAGRVSISFFMLLIVCMGYSVVRPSLGAAMKRCAILAATHFFFAVVYSLGTMLLDPESAGYLVLLVVFPLAITMTAFYVWTLSSITSTLATLELRQQHVKALMYRRLYRLLVFSVLMVIVIFILNMLNFSDRTVEDWAARNWKRRWFMLDGWLNILYFTVFFVIVILWRPTSNNSRYGLEQLAQDEEEALALENRLRRTEGQRHGDDDDDAAIFELGDDFSDDERDHSGSQWNSHTRQADVPKQDNKTATLHVPHQDSDDGEDDDEHLEDDERARLTGNARKMS